MLDHLDAPAPAGSELVAPIKSVAQSHRDEIAWRNAWINDDRVASYFWAVTRDKKVVVQEYDPCDCQDEPTSPTAHRNHFVDIPGVWKPIVIGQADAADYAHNPVKVDVTIPAFEATTDFAPFMFHAVPKTLHHQSLASLSVEIEPGMAIVYGHRTVTNRHDGGSHYMESLVFGRVLADKTEEVTQVYPNGDVVTHASLAEALAHEHETRGPSRVPA
jgi:hypothetical protein